MIEIKANLSFSGVVTMRQNEERECEKTEAIKDLIKCGYVSVIKEGKKAKNTEQKENEEVDVPPEEEKTDGEGTDGEGNDSEQSE